MSGSNGEVLVFGAIITKLSSLAVQTTNALDPNNSNLIVGTVTSVSGSVNSFDSPWGRWIMPSTWTLGTATGGCNNKIVFDKSQPSDTALNVTGCFVLNAAGGLHQNGVEVNMLGSNFDPAGIRPIFGLGSSGNFDLTQIGVGASVPTLSEWALIVTTMLFALAGASVLLRRRPSSGLSAP